MNTKEQMTKVVDAICATQTDFKVRICTLAGARDICCSDCVLGKLRKPMEEHLDEYERTSHQGDE